MLSVRAHLVLALAIAAASSMPASLPAAAQSFDGYYVGRLMCDPIPSKAIGALNIAFNMTLNHGNATYRRAIYTPDGKMLLTVETGEGSVSADGTVTLSGRAEFSTWHYQATYAGKVVANSLELSGKQHWEFADAPPYDRPCKASVTRQ